MWGKSHLSSSHFTDVETERLSLHSRLLAVLQFESRLSYAPGIVLGFVSDNLVPAFVKHSFWWGEAENEGKKNVPIEIRAAKIIEQGHMVESF